MPVDLTTAMIGATVQVDQPLAEGRVEMGTAFLVQAPGPDGAPRVVLVTAGHVFDDMPGPVVRLGYRYSNGDGTWRYQRTEVAIRDQGKPLWRRHPDLDVAAMVLQAPPEIARAAIPVSWLAGEADLKAADLAPGDQLYDLGFPGGYASNTKGFPILRVGWLASYPLVPVAANQTFLVDMRVFSGNSGGPVFIAPDARRHPGADESKARFVAGVLTGQAHDGDTRLDLAIVVQATYIRQTIDLLDRPLGAETEPVPVAAPAPTP